jgi:TonB-linked SusC/RagA family outer membrane protein
MKRCYMLLLAFFVAGTVAMAQVNVSGKITDERGDPLIGASVSVQGTTTGTITDFDGKYELRVPNTNVVLVVSYTGYMTREIALEGRSSLDVTLSEDTKMIEELVIVGYGTQRRSDLTGSVSSIKGSDIALAPVQSFDQALQGRAAGVNIITPNGMLNNPPVIRIRGINSVNLSSQPLIVIDGVPTYSGDLRSGNNSAANNPLGNINPADIESIEVLKDASAGAIYGSRAANGVILVTTKRGTKGKTRVSYDAWAGINQPFRLFDLLNAEQYMTIKNEAQVNAGGPADFYRPSFDADGRMIDTDWYKYVMRNGFSHNHNLNFSGGNDATTYFVSLGFTQQEGMLQRNDFDRVQARLNVDHQLIKRVKVGTSINYTSSQNMAPNSGSLPGQAFSTSGLGRLPLITAPNVAPYINDEGIGAYDLADGFRYNITANNQMGQMNNRGQIGFVNPAVVVNENEHTSRNDHFIANVYADLEILKGLNFRTIYGIDRLSIENRTFWTPIHGDGFGQGGFAENINDRLDRWNWQNILTYNVSLNERNNFSFLIGNEQQYTTRDRWGAQRTQIADPFFTTFQGNFTTINPAFNFQTENYLISYLGRANYDFDRMLFLTANFRRDGYSAWAPGNKYGNFWGGSAGFVVSELSGWQSLAGNTVNFLKARASYGQVGNSAVADFASLSLFGSGLYGPDATLFFGQAGNTALTWESSTKLDAGFSFGMFNDKLQGEFAYYRNDIDGLILAVPQAPSKGIPGNSIDANVGSMTNSGIELSLTYNAIRSRDFDWTVNLNITTQKNVVNQLGPDGSDIFGATSNLETANITRIGQPIGSLYAVQTAGVNPANGQRIFLRRQVVNGDTSFVQVQYNHAAPPASRWTLVSDGTPTGAVTVANSGVIFGPTLPTYFGGFINDFRYKNFDLNIMFQFQGGNYIYNGTQAGLRDMRFWNNHTDVLDRWTESNPNGTIPKVVFGDNVSNGSALPISENIQKGDFIRLRNLALGYTLPKSVIQKAKMTNLRVYAQVQNAFVLTGYTGADPEISTNGGSNIAPGVDRNSIGQARSYTIGVQVGL